MNDLVLCILTRILYFHLKKMLLALLIDVEVALCGLTLHFPNASDVESEKAMAPHSSTLAWKIPWTEEPGGLQSMGSLRVGHD